MNSQNKTSETEEPTPNHVDLMSTPEHLRRWLAGLPAAEIVARDMQDPTRCLGCSFLRANGYPAVMFGATAYSPQGSDNVPMPQWFRDVYHALGKTQRLAGKPIAAAVALAAMNELGL